jgi:hypothetical protein
MSTTIADFQTGSVAVDEIAGAERRATFPTVTPKFAELTGKDWILICCVPVIAIAVAVRQAYFNVYYELSTWKGGGMGMFADVDLSSRFMKIYVELPSGQRHPISSLTGHQQRLQSEALCYPIEAHFRALAASIRKTNWVSAEQLTPEYVVNAKGERVRPTGQSYYSLNAFGERPHGEDPDWTLIIEYWKTSYEPSTRMVHAMRMRTLSYAKGSL